MLAAQCTGSDVAAPTNGAFGSVCDGSTDVADGATCDLTCTGGFALTAQPICTGTTFSSTTATCTEVTCTQPATAGYDFSGVTEVLPGATFSATGIACATGYAGTAASAVCAADGAYTVSGCTEVTCTQPATASYDFSGVTEVLSGATFSVSSLACATGYDGTAAAAVCAADGAYTVSGCSAIVCTEPASIDGYTVTNNQLDVTQTFSVIAACAANYESTGAGPAAAACTASGAYVLSGCQLIVCTTPTTAGYTISAEQLTLAHGNGFVATVACAANYETTGAGPAAVACTASGAYTVSGCAEIVCTTPADTAGYTISAEQLNLATGGAFAATVVCDTAGGYLAHGHALVSR